MLTGSRRHTVGDSAKALSEPPGEYVGNDETPMKLKGIDGGPHKRRNMWFNSMIREEPYPGLNGKWRAVKAAFPSGHFSRCCMVVVSSCREVSGQVP